MAQVGAQTRIHIDKIAGHHPFSCVMIVESISIWRTIT
jgi:hypothetical protein